MDVVGKKRNIKFGFGNWLIRYYVSYGCEIKEGSDWKIG